MGRIAQGWTRPFALVTVLLATALSESTFAQTSFEFITDLPVLVGGDTLRNPWAGGLNAGQYSTIDLDRNGEPDLVVFDRTSDKINTFLRKEDGYHYDPSYEPLFPDDLRYWMLLADYNCDGKPDIFTYSSRGMRVFENTSDAQLSFTLVADPVLTEGNAGTFNLAVNSTDVPGIADVDGDGDLDVLVFNFAAGGTIEYHQNLSQETVGTCEALRFRRDTRAWGDFEECFCGEYAFGEPCSANGGRTARTEHVGGKSILTWDTDGDGDQDLAFGDETCTGLAFLENEGTPEQALFRAASDTFPVDANPANAFLFPAGYRAAVTSDGVSDLIVAPNVFSNARNSIDFTQSSWLYRNRGSEAQPRFELAQTDFLQREMIDRGANAAPALGDYDGDGDYDLLLGAETQTEQARLWLYENVGTPTNPVFQLVDTDYLNFSAEQFTVLKPSLADINGDGAVDLLVQAGGDGVTARLFYQLNQSVRGWNFAPGLQPLGVAPVKFDTPFFYDLNQDGRADLLLGQVTGRLEYHRNEGGNPVAFTLVTDSLAGITNNPFRRTLAPWVGDLNGDGQPELLTTDGSGVLRQYENFLDDTQPPTVTTTLIRFNEDEPQESHLGSRNWLAGADLYGTGRPVIALGNAQGGVYLLRSLGDGTRPAPGEGELVLTVFPNPNTQDDALRVRVNQPAQLLIYTVLGQLVNQTNRLNSGLVHTLDKTGLTDGVYIIKAIGAQGNTAVQRVIVR
ncbi:MAG: T9SS type A sorting domain-containing protein [Tunicatimonas sp.]